MPSTEVNVRAVLIRGERDIGVGGIHYKRVRNRLYRIETTNKDKSISLNWSRIWSHIEDVVDDYLENTGYYPSDVEIRYKTFHLDNDFHRADNDDIVLRHRIPPGALEEVKMNMTELWTMTEKELWEELRQRISNDGLIKAAKEIVKEDDAQRKIDNFFDDLGEINAKR